MSDCSDMEYSSDNDCEYDDYYNTGTNKKKTTTTNILII